MLPVPTGNQLQCQARDSLQHELGITIMCVLFGPREAQKLLTPAEVGNGNAWNANSGCSSACQRDNVRHHQVRLYSCQPGLLCLQQRSPVRSPCNLPVALQRSCSEYEMSQNEGKLQMPYTTRNRFRLFGAPCPKCRSQAKLYSVSSLPIA